MSSREPRSRNGAGPSSMPALVGFPPEPGDRPRAPGALALVQAFINTNDREGDSDALASPAAVKRWFTDHRFMAPATAVSSEQFDRTIELREALRQLALENAGSEVDPAAHTVVNREAERSGLTVRFSPDGRLDVAPAGAGFELAIANILAIVANAFADGTWHRLKACARDICRWVFYDRSRNRSAVWCAMSICGSRQKARAYYRRRRDELMPNKQAGRPAESEGNRRRAARRKDSDFAASLQLAGRYRRTGRNPP